MAKYGISKKAIADLDSIWNYTTQTWSEEQAVKYYRDIRDAIIGLSHFRAIPVEVLRRYDPVLWDIASAIILSSTTNEKMAPFGCPVFFTRRWITRVISNYSFFNSTAGLVFAAFQDCHKMAIVEIRRTNRTETTKIHQ